MAIGEALASLGGGLIGAAGTMWSNQRNLEFQREVQEYQKELQNRVFSREDTAIQRRVADLKAAGLSPVLAAGSGAASGATVQINPPHVEDPSAGAIAGARAGADVYRKAMANDIAAAQVDLIRNQAIQSQYQTEILKVQKDKIIADTKRSMTSESRERARGGMDWIDYGIYSGKDKKAHRDPRKSDIGSVLERHFPGATKTLFEGDAYKEARDKFDSILDDRKKRETEELKKRLPEYYPEYRKKK